MKPVLRYHSQLLFRKSYRVPRTLRFRPRAQMIEFRPKRDGPDKRTRRCPFGIAW